MNKQELHKTKERNDINLKEGLIDNQESFDERLVFISAGALYLVIETFGAKSNGFYCWVAFLYNLTVFLFGVTLVLVVFSYLYASKLYFELMDKHKKVDINSAYFVDVDYFNEHQLPLLNTLNWCILGIFTFGMLSLFLFLICYNTF